MKNDNWSSSDSRIKVSSKLPPNPALNYCRPDIKKVAVKIDCDDEDFMPTYLSDTNSADLFANLPSSPLVMTNGSCSTIDCGITLDIPSGYKCSVSSEISGVFLDLIGTNRIKVNATNLGKEIILHHKQKIARIWVEPVYIFEWITKG